MKIIFSLLLAFFLFTAAGINLFAQKTVTVILMRHAEKDTSDPKNTDPELSAEGKLRAQKLMKKIKGYRPKVIYSSNFIRTKATVTPLAEKRKIPIEIYDHRKLEDLIPLLMNSKAKKFVVVGHNTTTPALANLLIKQNKYEALPESVYNKIWIIKIKKNKIIEKVIEY